MSLGFGKVPPQDLDKLRQGGKGDQVDPGNYIGKLVSIRHIEPKNGEFRGVYILGFDLTEQNTEQWRGKHVECGLRYHADPLQVSDLDDRKKAETTCRMSMEQMLHLIDASNAEVMTDPATGASDLLSTVNLLVTTQPVVQFEVTHRTWDDRTFQDVKNFKPLGASAV